MGIFDSVLFVFVGRFLTLITGLKSDKREEVNPCAVYACTHHINLNLTGDQATAYPLFLFLQL